MFEKIFLVGNGRVADDCLRELVNRNVEVTYIEVEREKFSFTEKLCERCGIKFCHIEKKDVRQFFLDIKVDTLIISAHNSYIFPADVVEKSNLTVINLHIAYLPEYRGMNPSTWAIYNQEVYAGASWHEVDAGIDSGGIIVQEKVPILEDDTAMKLMLRCFETGIRLFKENLDCFLSKSYKPFPPNRNGQRLYLSKELPNEGVMNLKWDLKKAYAFLRSMDYSGANLMPLPKVENNGKLYEIVRYHKEAFANKRDSGNKQEDTLTAYEFENSELKIVGERHYLICQLREITD